MEGQSRVLYGEDLQAQTAIGDLQIENLFLVTGRAASFCDAPWSGVAQNFPPLEALRFRDVGGIEKLQTCNPRLRYTQA